MNIDYELIDKIVEQIQNHQCDHQSHFYPCVDVSNDVAHCADKIAINIKYWLINQLDKQTDKLECGCSNDEFGCQGYHGA